MESQKALFNASDVKSGVPIHPGTIRRSVTLSYNPNYPYFHHLLYISHAVTCSPSSVMLLIDHLNNVYTDATRSLSPLGSVAVLHEKQSK